MTSKLWIDLLPLSPDYSGVAAALYEFGGMTVIHDASGCTGNYTGYDEPRWYDEKSMVYYSRLYVDHQISMNLSSRFSYECLMDVLQTVLTFHP